MADPTIKSYRKKPLVVRAIQWDGEIPDILAPLQRAGELIYCWGRGIIPEVPIWLQVFNPGSNLWLPVGVGDYIILAPTGCRYPVKADQFERNYDPV